MIERLLIILNLDGSKILSMSSTSNFNKTDRVV